MSNNWTDIGNASAIVVMGANPVENHPASMAHVNRARDVNGATLTVVDPRKTRTALQADRFIRHRPGTDIALINGIIRGIIAEMEARDVADPQRVKFYEFLNWGGGLTFWTDGGAALTPIVVTDESVTLTGTTAATVKHPKIAAASVTVTNLADTVTYTEGALADYTVNYAAGTIVRTATSTIASGETVLVDYTTTNGSYLLSVPGASKYTDARFLLEVDGSDYQRETLYAGTTDQISNFPKMAATVTADPNTVYNRLKAHVAPYTPAVVADITGVTEADIAYLVSLYINNSRCASVSAVSGAGVQDPRQAGYKCLTMMYAMGLTQHTCGGQNVKSFATIQSLMGNNGRAGGGINALRGIHNVQGSTDAGNLQHLIPFYSGNPTVMTTGGVAPITNDANAFGKYMDPLWGSPLNGSGTRATMDMSYDDAYNTGAMGLQQRGFLNMTYNFFGKHDYNPVSGLFDTWMATPTASRALTNALYDLWPKGNGADHITMFRDMIAGTTTAAVVWGQNPAITEPNQSKVRDGLYNLDTLVVVDMFQTETAACKRKPTGWTYLLPACSHVEEAGSVVNSGRVLQWRERAALPKGNSKSDLELLFRFAKALDVAGAFAHIKAVWSANAALLPGGTAPTDAYAVLYGDRYGWTPGGPAFEGVASAAGMAQPVEIWRGKDDAPTTGTVNGSEWFAELMYRELCRHVNNGGTSWLWVNAYTPDYTSNRHATMVSVPGNAASAPVNWQVYNRSKSRDFRDPMGTLAFGAWGYAWLVNRRVLYGNSDPYLETADGYQGPDKCARLYVTSKTAVAFRGRYLNYSSGYRFYHGLSDKPDTGIGNPHILPGRFPAHVEPYETPREDLAAVWGRNTRGGAAFELVPADSNVAAPGRSHNPANFPFVLTTIRCVEHFQGGPITRNNPWNHEAEPEPWIEINSVDALALGIKDGDWVNVSTARGDSIASQVAKTIQSGPLSAGTWAKGFKARVGVGTQANQRVAPGVVAIPWHWGDRGLSTGSRANDLCIDAGDANTTIPESKACLCNIVKVTP